MDFWLAVPGYLKDSGSVTRRMASGQTECE